MTGRRDPLRRDAGARRAQGSPKTTGRRNPLQPDASARRALDSRKKTKRDGPLRLMASAGLVPRRRRRARRARNLLLNEPAPRKSAEIPRTINRKDSRRQMSADMAQRRQKKIKLAHKIRHGGVPTQRCLSPPMKNVIKDPHRPLFHTGKTLWITPQHPRLFARQK